VKWSEVNEVTLSNEEADVTQARDQNNKHDKLVQQLAGQNSDCVMP